MQDDVLLKPLYSRRTLFSPFSSPEHIRRLKLSPDLAITKSSFVCYGYSPGSNFRFFESLAKMAKIKFGQKNPFLQYYRPMEDDIL